MPVVGVSGVNALIQKKSKYYILPPAVLLSFCFPKPVFTHVPFFLIHQVHIFKFDFTGRFSFMIGNL